jgi:hypothetical protein
MQEILRETEQAGVEFDWIEPGKGFFNDLSAALKNSGRKYLFLLDEVDYLVLDPEIGLLEEFVRNMSNMGYAQFVFSGYRILRSRTEDRSSFFHNLFQSMPLGPLNKREAEELVRTQMDRILVRFENQQVVEEILNLGSTFASTLQFMCDLLLKRLDEPDHDRCVTAADVRAVYDSAEFSKEITSAALESGEQGMGPLERLILCWAAACEFEQFTKKDLMEWLGRTVHFPKLSEVGGALNYLAATYLLAEVQGKYYFYMPHLREKLRAPEYDIEYVLNYLMREYRERQEWLRAAESAR